MEVIDFDTAIELSSQYSKRHLLLGNGFSIACRQDIFQYGRLFDQADFSKLHATALSVFSVLSTHDFERVINALRVTAKITPLYDVDIQQAQTISDDADVLKEILIETIAKSHPEQPNDLGISEYDSCQQFLSHFEDVYTFNYDLLLYWTCMNAQARVNGQYDDGFRTSQDDVESGDESNYVVWNPNQSRKQSTFYLHGALHIFDSGDEIQKYTWRRTGIRLIDQIREALNKGLFPLIVAEGTSAEKLARIRHSDYLSKAYRSFQSIQYSLFVFGHSLAENDDHILKLIERGKLSHLFVGLYGDQNSDANQFIIRRTQSMMQIRPAKSPLIVNYYDSESANVWGNPKP